MTDKAVTFPRPIQQNRPTLQSIHKTPDPVNQIDVAQRQDTCLTHRGHPIPLTTDGDRLISTRRVHQKEAIPRPSAGEASPHFDRGVALHQVAGKSWEEKENKPLDPPRAFLIQFKHGFHREITVCSMGKWVIYYITPKGARIRGKKNLGPHIHHLKNVTEENFTFQPIELSIRDPLNKYQSIRHAEPNRRSTHHAVHHKSYQPAFGEISTESARKHAIPQDGGNSKHLTETEIQNKTLSYKTPWQIEYVIQRGDHIPKKEKERCPGLWSLRGHAISYTHEISSTL